MKMLASVNFLKQKYKPAEKTTHRIYSSDGLNSLYMYSRIKEKKTYYISGKLFNT